MAQHGTIGEFDPEKEDWTSYTERLQQYFTANDVDNASKQRAILLSVCRPKTYQLIRNLIAPAKPVTKSLEEIVQLVQEHHHPKPSAIVQRYHFHSRFRQEGESISTYVSELKKLSEHCNFQDSLNDMLRDRLVCGVNDARLQRRLLAEPDLTFGKAMELALALEAAERNAKDIVKPGAAAINMVHKQVRPGGAACSPVTPCFRCGNKHSSTCRFKDAECLNCGKKGHLARVCVVT